MFCFFRKSGVSTPKTVDDHGLGSQPLSINAVSAVRVTASCRPRQSARGSWGVSCAKRGGQLCQTTFVRLSAVQCVAADGRFCLDFFAVSDFFAVKNLCAWVFIHCSEDFGARGYLFIAVKILVRVCVFFFAFVSILVSVHFFACCRLFFVFFFNAFLPSILQILFVNLNIFLVSYYTALFCQFNYLFTLFCLLKKSGV